MINLGTATKETKGSLFYTVDVDGKVQCTLSGQTSLQHRKAIDDGQSTQYSCFSE